MGAANIFTGRVLARTEHTVHLETPSGLRMVCQCNAAVAVGTALSVVVRPDVVQVVPHGWTWTGDNAFSGRVLTKTYLGEVTALTVTLPAGDTVLCHVPSRLEQQFGYQEATAVLVGWQAQDAHVLQVIMRSQATFWALWWMAGLIVTGSVLLSTSQVRAQDASWEQYMAEGAQAYQNGQETTAEMFYLAALEHVQSAGPGDPRLAATLNTLAVLYHSQRKYVQAESLYQHVLQLLEQTIGPDHPTLATTLNNLAVVYEAQEKYGEAVPLYQRALALLERTLGPEHPNLAATLDNYADLLHKMQREAEAASVEARARAIWAQQKRESIGK